MKRNLLLTCLSIFCFSAAFSQIIYKDYGNGLVIGMNENYSMDIDDDGVEDFYINQWSNELGFVPIFGKGCFSSPTETSYTNFGSRELQLHEEGEIIQITGINMYDYIDDDRGSAYSETGGLAENWVNNEDRYIGFAVFRSSGDFGVANGWMRVSIDTEAKTLTLKEMAYQDYTPLDEGFIETGNRGTVAIKNLDEVLNEVVISPNPVRDIMQLDFKYTGEEKLQISILDNTGKLVTNQTANGSNNYIFDTTAWTPGLYFVNFATANGVRSEKIFVAK